MNIKFLLLIIMAGGLVSCKKPDPQPELKDKLYLEFKRRHDELDDYNYKFQFEVKSMKESVEDSTPREPIRQMGYRRDYKLLKRTYFMSIQAQKYFAIKMQKRREYVREKYILAYNLEKVPELLSRLEREYEEYVVNQRLKEALDPRQQDWIRQLPVYAN